MHESWDTIAGIYSSIHHLKLAFGLESGDGHLWESTSSPPKFFALDNLPTPDVLASEIAEDLEAALQLFQSITSNLEPGVELEIH